MKNRNLRKLFLILLALYTHTRVVEAAIPPQNLIKGQSVTLTVDYEIGDVAITDDKVCDYLIRDSRREIYLNPRKQGSTKMTVWDATGKKRDEFHIQVQDITIDAIYNEAVQKFGDFKGIKIELNNGWVVLTGKIDSRHQYRQGPDFFSKYPQVENGVRLSEAVVETMIQQIEKEIGIPGVRVRQVRSQLLLEGLVYSNEANKKAETIARLYAPAVVNLIEVRESSRRPGEDRLVQIDIHLMEIKKSALRSLGISWAPGATARSEGPGIGGLLSSVVGTATNLLPKINLIRQSGGGRVLENPKLLVKSGESADFFSGVTIPFRTERAVEFKDAGVTIKASPIATANDIDMQIEVELSSIAPGSENIDRNSLKTTVFCPVGKSVVLGGIVRNRDTKVFNKAPQNADSALIALSLSKDFQSNKSEFLIIMTPQILEKPTPASEKLEEWIELNDQVVRDRSKKESRQEKGSGT